MSPVLAILFLFFLFVVFGLFCERHSWFKAFLMTLFLGLTVASVKMALTGMKPKTRVSLFVIDSAVADRHEIRRQLSFFRDLTHGDIVLSCAERWVDTDNVFFFGVDGFEGGISMRKYLDVLNEIIEYTRTQRDERVVVNVSFGSSASDPEEEKLIRKLVDRGVIVVAAAGNDNSSYGHYPAAYSGVIAVAACEKNKKARYSNYGAHVNIADDGEYEAEETINMFDSVHHREIKASGTSISSPSVAGKIAYALARNPALGRDEIYTILMETSVPIAPESLRMGKVDTNEFFNHAIPGYKRARLIQNTSAVFALVSIPCWVVFCCRRRRKSLKPQPQSYEHQLQALEHDATAEEMPLLEKHVKRAGSTVSHPVCIISGGKSKCYHRKDCPHVYDKSVIQLTKEGAEKIGYYPCKNCKP